MIWADLASVLRQAQHKRMSCVPLIPTPLSLSLSKHVLSFAEGAARNLGARA